jgi:cobalamin biosynthesis protein CobD/CbiB
LNFFSDKAANELASFRFSKMNKGLAIATIAFGIFVLLMVVVNCFMFIAKFLLNIEVWFVPIYIIVAGFGGFLATGFFSMYDLGVVNTKYKNDLDKIRAKYNIPLK